MIINQKNLATGALYLIFGLVVAYVSAGYQVGTALRMGPGFFPFFVGLLLAAIGLVIAIGSLRNNTLPEKIGHWPVKVITIITLSVIIFGLVLKPLGILLATTILVFISSMAHTQFKWRTAFYLCCILLPFTWLVFVVLLGLQFPVLPTFLTR